MNYWLRLYTDILEDPKVQKLPAEIFKGWINVLCLAKENDGILPSIEDTAFRLRMTETDATSLIEELVRRGLLDAHPENQTLKPHNWDNRQYKSDVSTERVKRFRNAQRNVSETADETPPETETETETEQKPVGTGGTRPASTSGKKAPDPRKDHVAITAIRSVAHSYPPKEIWDDLISLLGESPDRPKLEACRKEWVKRGYKPTNWAWVTEWYANGIQTNGASRAGPQGRDADTHYADGREKPTEKKGFVC